jgi:hypothetical protein
MFKEKVIEGFFEELSKSRHLSFYGGKCIDIFYEDYVAKNPADIIKYSIKIANEFWFRNQFKQEIEIIIHVELINEFSHLKGLPKSRDELYGEIFMLSVPDISVLSISKNARSNPKFEQYISPLPFKLEGLNENIHCFYREYRVHDEQFDWEDTYTREVFFSV